MRCTTIRITPPLLFSGDKYVQVTSYKTGMKIGKHNRKFWYLSPLEMAKWQYSEEKGNKRVSFRPTLPSHFHPIFIISVK